MATYTEASLRMGRMHDTASDILRDALGGSYGYNVHADYYGGHVGIGKIYRFDGGRRLDVYGKFFVTKRNGVSFDAGGHYDLDHHQHGSRGSRPHECGTEGCIKNQGRPKRGQQLHRRRHHLRHPVPCHR
ncbi:MAG: hypothetical protein II178_03680, partial [Selenomonadaceae bacterium]|nr:hypothetical protein [Selenomonadaceae bacterium]